MITQDDVIYFVITDRFCDGNGNNNILVDKNNPRRYHGGDFAGIIKKIPYLKNLGITALWITPVYLSVGRVGNSDGYHGYWALDFDKVDPHLYSKDPALADGSKKYLERLSSKLHENGIKLILDMVVNHTGYHNETYREYPEKEIPDDWFNEGNGDDVIKSQLCGLPDLNHGKPDVVDYFVNNIIGWIEQTQIDAIRMDTVKHVEDTFWYHFKSYVKGKYRNITLIGEVLQWDIDSISRYQKEHDFDTLFDFPLCEAIKKTFIHNESMTALARPRISQYEPRGILDCDKLYTNANRLVTLLDNHDLNKRFMTEILDKWGHWDRMRANNILKLSLSFLFTTRGIPQLYYGTEIGMEGYCDPDNRRDMRWQIFGQDNLPFEQYRYERDIFKHTQKLIEIRQQNEAIRYGYLLTLYSDYFVYCYMREYKGNTIIVAINNGLEDTPCPVTIKIAENANIPQRIKSNIGGKVLVNLFNPQDRIAVENGCLNVRLSDKEARIYKVLDD
jgi:glycosidase